VEQVGVNDNFFDLGGHSLLAARVFSHLKDSDYSVDLPIRKIFEYPILEDLAEQVTLSLISEEEMSNIIGEIKNLSEDELYRKLS
jgi:hypothetical protein